MAVTLDQTLGTGKAHASLSVSFNTTAAVAVDGRIVVVAAFFDAGSGTTLTVSGGGLTWTQDHFVSSGSLRMRVASAPCPSGLASGTTITATANGAGGNDMMIEGISLLGVDTASPVVAFNGAPASTAAWSSGNISAGAGNAIVGGAFCDGLVGSSTAGGSNTEFADQNDATQNESMTGVYNLSTAATDSASGTWSGAVSHIAIGVAYRAASAAAASPNLPMPLLMLLQPTMPVGLPPMQMLPRLIADTLTLLTDSDTATATEGTTDVQATVPGSDSSTATDTGTVSATASDSDSATGSDSGTVSATVPGSDSGTASESGSVSESGSGSDSGMGSEGGTVFATVTDSDSATATDAQVSIVSPVIGSDSATASETDSVSGSGSSSDSGSGSDSGTVSATVTGSDSATATDTGSVQDITGGPTPISGSDSAAATDDGTVVDLTPAPQPQPGPTGGTGMVDETSIYGEFRAITDSDVAFAWEYGFAEDQTVRVIVKPRVKLPLPRRRELRREVTDSDSATAREAWNVVVLASGSDAARASDAAPPVQDRTVAAAERYVQEFEEEWAILQFLSDE